MNQLLKLLAPIFFISFSLYGASSGKEQYVQMSLNVVTIGSNDYLAVTLDNQEKWHTYWKNPGYAGLPIKIKFYENNKAINLEASEWPVPQKFIEQEDMLTYGYEGAYSLFYRLNEKVSKLKVHGTWLVCKDICIPGEQTKNIEIINKKISKNKSKVTSAQLIRRFNDLPEKTRKPKDLNFYFVKIPDEESLMLQFEIENFDIKAYSKNSNVLYPFLTTPLDFRKEELYFDKDSNTLYGQMKIAWDGEYEDPVWPLPSSGKLQKEVPIKFLYKTKSGASTFDIMLTSFQTTGFSSSQKSLANFINLSNKENQLNTNSDVETSSIYTFFLFAFLGGLILNLMPCVLPVISLKLFGLISHSNQSRARILRHNLAYSLGVLISFLALATGVYLLKNAGEEIGWGFQMQSPPFVFFMLIVVFVLALNMMGLFEFRTPGGKSLGSVKSKDGFFNDFLGGIFATILATPCSAPFLGSALTFAFTTSTSNLFLIFMSIGLGLSFPFIITGIFPTLISFLPKPGLWMIKLKYFLGLSLLITFAWLFDVFANLISMEFYGIYTSLFFVFLFFAIFAKEKISKAIIANVLFFTPPVLLLATIVNQNALSPMQDQLNVSIDSNWDVWSEQNMNDTKGATFVDFTAKWCLTCKVNKKLVLDTQDFKEFVHANKISLMRADWTRRDEHITKFLRSNNIIGVPAYFIKMKEGKIISLGETISINKIKEAFNQ